MNPKVKKKWLKALRSGEYKQTAGFLHDEEGFCCLGVLTDLYLKEKKVPKDKRWIPSGQCFRPKGSEEIDITPAKVEKWAGLPQTNPVCNELGLAEHNDGVEYDGIKPKSFKQIANLIEKHL